MVQTDGRARGDRVQARFRAGGFAKRPTVIPEFAYGERPQKVQPDRRLQRARGLDAGGPRPGEPEYCLTPVLTYPISINFFVS